MLLKEVETVAGTLAKFKSRFRFCIFDLYSSGLVFQGRKARSQSQTNLENVKWTEK